MRTYPQVCVDGGVAGGASQVLVLPVGNVLVGASVSVFLGQAEVDDVHQVALLAQTHEEVIGLHVSVDEVLRVDVLDTADLKHTHTHTNRVTHRSHDTNQMFMRNV